MFYQSISFEWLVLISPFIAFFITWYTGFLAARLSHRIKNKKLSIVLTIVFIWIPASMMVFFDYSLMGISGGTMAQVNSFWNYFGVIVGIIAGAFFGYTEKLVEEGKSVFLLRLQAMAVPSALFFFYLGFYTTFKLNYPPYIFFALTFASFFGIYKLVAAIDDNKEHKVSLFYLLFRAYIFPFIIIATLCLWQEVFIWGKINQAIMKNTALTIPGMLGYLVITGIIPIRIIMAIQPTATLFGIVTGLCSIGYFFYSIVRIVTSVFG